VSEACEFTILMPCLNEAETLASCISKARAFLARSGCTGEVVIADNGSTDRSQAIAAANGAGWFMSPSGDMAALFSAAFARHVANS
jgi:glycosyltransferase involved in cell wall biosynthesis